MKTILVLEDEMSIRSFITVNLERNGYRVIEAETGEQALELFSENKDQIDIALLDVMLPGIDGFQVCKEMRAKNERIGIIMLTARVQEVDRVHGLMSGADDYINKPFIPSELIARIYSLLRRMNVSSDGENNKIDQESITLFSKEKRVKKDGKMIDLTPTEFMILKHLRERKGQAVSRNDLLDDVWGLDYPGDPKIVDVNMRRLRQKIEEDPSDPKWIETVWGYGYKWTGEL
ncbi:response regulator transcription factor [Chengkuizengella axinellae]|uniref:Response regulator transcription factor n=1 Tax=Chengkuizengella axinellae TaxID=3064388 RepID=A0ABT9J4B8_9BACL|nr:response regulator transcription factor [Chengkuizengella sp. 2205SS18-9]MDP5276393.1 response regulator transcription factor [Chengkuizengella sp. 2205SS18-9]